MPYHKGRSVPSTYHSDDYKKPQKRPHKKPPKIPYNKPYKRSYIFYACYGQIGYAIKAPKQDLIIRYTKRGDYGRAIKLAKKMIKNKGLTYYCYYIMQKGSFDLGNQKCSNLMSLLITHGPSDMAYYCCRQNNRMNYYM